MWGDEGNGMNTAAPAEGQGLSDSDTQKRIPPSPDAPAQAEHPSAESYLDNAATTQLLPEALEAARPFLQEAWHNPSSLYAKGMDVRRALENARKGLAAQLGVPPQAVLFTSGGTESDNMALNGVFSSGRLKGDRLLVSALEHPAVLAAARALESRGVRVGLIPATPEGVVDLQAFSGMLDDQVRLVSCMAVNNELGTVQPLKEMGELIRKSAPRALFHVDAAQGFTRTALPWKSGHPPVIPQRPQGAWPQGSGCPGALPGRAPGTAAARGRAGGRAAQRHRKPLRGGRLLPCGPPGGTKTPRHAG